jgi:hypothetical protein
MRTTLERILVAVLAVMLVEGLAMGWAAASSGHRARQAAPAAVVVSHLGDRDNFGYGLGTGPPPCSFFNNRGEGDYHVFDYETSANQTRVWTHRFAVTGTPTMVTLKVWEIFSDGRDATIDLDGHTFTFVKRHFSQCGYPEGGVKRTFVLTGADALIAADGSVTVTFKENGDNIALDRSMLEVTEG